jgi:hypothetical protein
MSLLKNFKKDPLCHTEFISASYGINVLETLKQVHGDKYGVFQQYRMNGVKGENALCPSQL